jgi:shikimate dehydrogenase
MTSKFGVVGSPIGHSLSPAIHKAAYTALGFDFSYDRSEVSAGDLSEFLAQNSFDGVSVTMPLKYEAFSVSDEHSREAKETSVVNTLVRNDGKWIGHNTDVAGFRGIFKQLSEPSNVAVIGSGATARSAVFAISSAFPGSSLWVMGRSISSVEDLVSRAREFRLDVKAKELSTETLVGSDLVVSTVPGDALGELWEQVSTVKPSAGSVLIDVSYNPWPSRASLAWGAQTISGLELLIWQAIEQVKLFAQSQGKQVGLGDRELYDLMIEAVNKHTEPK